MKRLLSFFVILCASMMLSAAGEALHFVTLPLADDPIVSFKFVFHLGSMNDPAGKSGLASLTAEMMSGGSTKKNKLDEIIKKLYPLASGYNVRVDREYITFFGQTHRDNVNAFYTMMKEAILEPAFLEEDFSRIKAETVTGIQNDLRYSSDEELGKAVFKGFVYRGTAYEKPLQGTVGNLETITLNDIKAFYAKEFTQKRLTVGLSGNYPPDLEKRIRADFAVLPVGAEDTRTSIVPEKIVGRQVLIVDKKADATGIHIGFPLSVLRGDPDFYSLFLVNSWLGEHRNSFSHLYQVIREARGFNYGDYSYIEDFPGGGFRRFPPTNVVKKPQLFEIWIRPVPNNVRVFTLRAALRELQTLVEKGMTKENFELTKKFLSTYYLNYAPTSSERLGYLIDDRIYGLQKSYLATFAANIQKLTLEQVNAAIKKHLQTQNLKIVIVTSDGEKLKAELAASAPSPITYRTPKPDTVMQEDKIIETFPLDIKAENITIVPVEKIFQ